MRLSLRPKIMRALLRLHISTTRELNELVNKFENQQNRLTVCKITRRTSPKQQLSKWTRTKHYQKCRPEHAGCLESEVAATHLRNCWIYEKVTSSRTAWKSGVGSITDVANFLKSQCSRYVLSKTRRTWLPPDVASLPPYCAKTVLT